MEFCVKPYEQGRVDVIENFKELFIEFEVSIRGIDIQIAERAAQLRSQNKTLKAMDALQLATAINSGASEFITNDRALTSINGIDIILVASL